MFLKHLPGHDIDKQCEDKRESTGKDENVQRWFWIWAELVFEEKHNVIFYDQITPIQISSSKTSPLPDY